GQHLAHELAGGLLLRGELALLLLLLRLPAAPAVDRLVAADQRRWVDAGEVGDQQHHDEAAEADAALAPGEATAAAAGAPVLDVVGFPEIVETHDPLPARPHVMAGCRRGTTPI